MDNCCASIVKYFMVLCNILFAIAGIALMGFGTWSQLGARDYLNFLGDSYVNTPIFIIIVGGIIFAISLFGCCGACYEKKFLLYIYAGLLILIVLAQIGAGIAVFAVKGKVETVIEENMEKGMTNYGVQNFEGVTTTWDIVQKGYKCCGVEKFSDWVGKGKANFTTGQAPDSCCVGGQIQDCGIDGSKKFFEDGCFNKFKGDFVDNLGIVGGVALGVALVEVMVIALACCLGKKTDTFNQYV